MGWTCSYGQTIAAVSCVLLAACSRGEGEATTAGAHDTVSAALAVARADDALAARLAPRAEAWIAAPDGARTAARRADGSAALVATLAPRADGALRVGGAGTAGAAEASFTLSGAAPSPLAIDEGRAVYRDVLASTDAVVAAGSRWIEAAYLLRDERAPRTFAWDVALAEGLSLRPRDDGGASVVDAVGREHLRVAPPYLVDARGTRRDAKLAVDGARLAMDLDTAGLVFPVVVDPWIQQPIVWTSRTTSAQAKVAALGASLYAIDAADGQPARVWRWDDAGWSWTEVSTPSAPTFSYGYPPQVFTRGSAVEVWRTPYAGDFEVARFDGTSWSAIAHVAAPAAVAPLANQSIALGVSGQDVLLFAQATTGSWPYPIHVFSWNGSAWTDVTPSGTAPALNLYGPSIAPLGSGFVVVGGSYSYAYSDGTHWIASGDLPVSLSSSRGLAAVGSQVLLYEPYNKQSLQFDGSAWTLLSSYAGPDGTQGFTTIGTKALTYSGRSVWTWNGGWSRSPAPPAQLVSPVNVGSTVVAESSSCELTAWDGLATNVLPHFNSGCARLDEAAARAGKLVMLAYPTSTQLETWELDLSANAWTKSAANAPSFRHGSAVSSFVSAGTEKVVLFGGYTVSGGSTYTYLNDTWVWDGAAWTKATIPDGGSPPSGSAAGVRLVPYRGKALEVSPDFGWEWDGAAWTKVPGSGPPADAGTHTVRYAAAGASVLGFYARWSDGVPVASEWDGSAWTDVAMSNAPAIFGNVAASGSTLIEAYGDEIWTASALSIAGAPCSTGAECASGTCEDGAFCCDTPCTGTCRSCRHAKTGQPDGTCAPVTIATDPDDECPVLGSGTCQTTGLCDGAGACQYRKGIVCAPPSCSNTTSQVNAATCESDGYCPGQTSTSCGAYKCQGTACLTQCATDGDCQPGNFCDTAQTPHVCKSAKSQGDPCTKDAECPSLHCVDGVCCNTECAGDCAACSSAKKGYGADGVCQAIAALRDPDDECGEDANAFCSKTGACDGKGACAVRAQGTPCDVNATCSGGKAYGNVCDGNGLCVTSTTGVPCFPYLSCKSATACATSCAGDPQCDATFFCDAATQTCEPDQPPGAPCTRDSQCGTGQCVDGFCCETTCDGTCEWCGEPASPGQCVAVSGAPKGGGKSCGGAVDACAPACDGSRRDGCTYPAQGTIVTPASCSGDSLVPAATCDGAGAVQTLPAIDCGEYACGSGPDGGPGCKTSCATSADCKGGATCDVATSTCNASGTTCAGAYSVKSTSGTITPCPGGYACKAGQCQSSCSVPSDCDASNGYACEAGKCVTESGAGGAGGTGGEGGAAGAAGAGGEPATSPPPADDAGSSGGCATAPPRGGTTPGAAVVAIGAALLARRRRRAA